MYVQKEQFHLILDCPVTENELNIIFNNRNHNGFKYCFIRYAGNGFIIYIPEFMKTYETIYI